MSGVDTTHPQITSERKAEWALMAAAADGESAIKREAETYLPRPSGFAATSNPQQAYDSYKKRASFPEIVAPSIGAMVGIIHGKEISIELPDALEPLRESATPDGLTLEAFHRSITRELLTFGRYGVLADAPEGGGEVYLVGYSGSLIINWDTDFYVLDESGVIRSGFDWEDEKRYRVLQLEDGTYTQTVYTGDTLAEGEPVVANALGGSRLTFVPFAVANARDLVPDVEVPPLIGVANAAVDIYQLDADQRHQLHMSGQETLVAINGDAPKAVGAGVVHSMMGGEGQGQQPDLKYVSPSCSGIEAHERAMDKRRESAVMAGARMFEQRENTQESGEARKLRFASETANLMSVALASCGLLERSLRNAAQMAGQQPDSVTVTPPSDLLDHTMSAAEAGALFQIWSGGGMSFDTYYSNLLRGGIADPDRSAEDELAAIDRSEFGDDPTTSD